MRLKPHRENMSVAKSMHLLFSCGQIKHRLCTKNIEHSLAFFLYLISQIRSNQYYIQHEYDMIILIWQSTSIYHFSHNSHDTACRLLKISPSLKMKEALTWSCFYSLQKKLHTVLQCVLPPVSVHHTSCLRHGLCWTHMDADCSERRSRCTERKAAQQ